MGEPNAALQQFMINTLNESGGGGLHTGGGSGSSFMTINGALSELNPPSIEGMKRNIQPAFKSVVSLLEAKMEGLSPANLGIFSPQTQLPAGIVSSSSKIAGLFSAGKGGR